jgi:hypothetical protein
VDAAKADFSTPKDLTRPSDKEFDFLGRDVLGFWSELTVHRLCHVDWICLLPSRLLPLEPGGGDRVSVFSPIMCLLPNIA